jgi:hypothetical protein
MIDILELYKQQGVCCASGKPMADSHNLNLVTTDYIANWKYPVGGIIGSKINTAMAIVHDSCIDAKGVLLVPIKNCIEFNNGKIIYHPVESLQVNKPIATFSNN